MNLHFKPYQIKCVSSADGNRLFDLISRNSNRLKKYFPITVSQNLSVTATEDYIQNKIQEANEQEAYTAVIIDTITECYIGLVIIKKINVKNGSCEFAYFIDSDYEGKGIISKAIKELISYCFQELQLEKILLQIGLDNRASVRVAEKNNFIKTHCITNGHKDLDGKEWDVAYYELSKSAYLTFK